MLEKARQAPTTLSKPALIAHISFQRRLAECIHELGRGQADPMCFALLLHVMSSHCSAWFWLGMLWLSVSCQLLHCQQTSLLSHDSANSWMDLCFWLCSKTNSGSDETTHGHWKTPQAHYERAYMFFSLCSSWIPLVPLPKFPPRFQLDTSFLIPTFANSGLQLIVAVLALVGSAHISAGWSHPHMCSL